MRNGFGRLCVREPLFESMDLMNENLIECRRVHLDLAAGDFDHDEWNNAQAVPLTRYWSGEEAPPGRWAEARVLWSSAGLFVRFICAQTEPLIIRCEAQTEAKTIGLWDYDVCEIFVAPDEREPERYYEFEAAPTGEWLDLAIRKKGDVRETDWEFHSGMTSAARISENQIEIAMHIPWKAFGRRPLVHERWRVNLMRCVGTGEPRGYLAWRPTYTEQPDFHVPEVFGEIVFK